MRADGLHRGGTRACRALLLAAVLSLGLAPTRVARAQGSGPPPGAEDRLVGERISTFYKAPDIAAVPALLSRWASSPSAQRADGIPPVVGFAAGLAAKYPAQISAMFPSSLPPKAQQVAVLGVRIGASSSAAENLARSFGWPPEKVATAGRGGTIKDVRISSGTDLDILWGASFASGDAGYVGKILTFYDEFTKRADIDVGDLIAVVRHIHSRQGDTKWVLQKYGEARTRELVVASAALWALDSNSRQHAFVREAVDRFLAQRAGSPAANGLRTLRPARATSAKHSRQAA